MKFDEVCVRNIDELARKCLNALLPSDNIYYSEED